MARVLMHRLASCGTPEFVEVGGALGFELSGISVVCGTSTRIVASSGLDSTAARTE